VRGAAVARPLLWLVLFLLTPFAAGAQEFPAPVGRVNDFARLLRAEDRQALEELLSGIERDTSAEIAVVTVRSLEGRSVEEYANRLFSEWGIGKKDRDNGVLILVARDDREMRIEVGYGLEGVLPDGLAGAIIRETFVPHFQSGDYPTGIREGAARVADIVRRNETVTPEQLAAIDQAAVEAGKDWAIAAFLSLFVGVGAFTAGTAAGARVIVQMLFGLVFMGLALFMAMMGAPRTAVLLLAVFAVAVLVTGYRLGQRPSWRRSMRGTGKGAGGSGWMAGGGGGGRSSSSGGSSSGSSFGGGSSGGGGASGRW
jgi:uncharacterized protein